MSCSARRTPREPPPTISIRAPSRVDLSPGFPDVEPFSDLMACRIVNVTIDLNVIVTTGSGGDRTTTTGFPAKIISQAARVLQLPSIDLSCSAPDLPLGCGLGSSGALSVAMTYAMALVAGHRLGATELVKAAYEAERDAGVMGGTQDQLASVYGGLGLVQRFKNVGTRTGIQTDLDALQRRVTLVHRGGTRDSTSIIKSVLRHAHTEVTLNVIRDMNRIGQATSELFQAGDLAGLSSCMAESTHLLSRLNPHIVDPDFQKLLHALGADTAKPCGAGGPSAVWAVITEPDSQDDFRRSAIAQGLRILDARFTPHGAHAVTS